MYALASHLFNLPVVSLQSGETIAAVTAVIVDPGQFRLIALGVASGKSPKTLLASSGIRQLATDCVIVDSEEELSEPDEIVRLAPILELDYDPIAKRVVTEGGHHLGSVEDYSINLETDYVQKIYVRPPAHRAWFSSSLIIDRAQIVEVQISHFVVKETYQFAGKLNAEASSAEAS